MYLFDTDTLSNALDSRRNCPQLRDRILRQPPENLYISIVTVDEFLHKILPAVRRAQSGSQRIAAYTALAKFLEDLKSFNILPYDEAAERAFQGIPESTRRHHPGDARIAASALSRGFTVVTSNRRHFEPTGVSVEDWMLLETPEE